MNWRMAERDDDRASDGRDIEVDRRGEEHLENIFGENELVEVHDQAAHNEINYLLHQIFKSDEEEDEDFQGF